MKQGASTEAAEAVVGAVVRGDVSVPISAADRAMLAYAVKLTRAPESMGAGDVEALRAAGFGDIAIHDIAQVTALFNYYNRLADGLGIESEPDPLRHDDPA